MAGKTAARIQAVSSLDHGSPLGWRPVSSWHSSTPSAHTSVAVDTGSPRTCSGAAQAGV